MADIKTLVEEAKRLLTVATNATFDCGEWSGESAAGDEEPERAYGPLAQAAIDAKTAVHAAINALAALAQAAPTAEVALPAVSGETQRLILETARDLLLMDDTPSRSRRRCAGGALDAMLKGNLAEQLPAVSEEVDGWATVPNSATHNMLNAANAGRKKGRSSSGDIYRAMIEAAPKLARAQSTRQSASVAGLAAEGGEAPSDLARDSLKDSLRLDWCERHAVGIENNRDMDGSSVWDVFGADNNSGKTLRAAIDAAAFPATPVESQEKAE